MHTPKANEAANARGERAWWYCIVIFGTLGYFVVGSIISGAKIAVLVFIGWIIFDLIRHWLRQRAREREAAA